MESSVTLPGDTGLVGSPSASSAFNITTFDMIGGRKQIALRHHRWGVVPPMEIVSLLVCLHRKFQPYCSKCSYHCIQKLCLEWFGNIMRHENAAHIDPKLVRP